MTASTLGERINAVREQLDRAGDVDQLDVDQLGGPLRALLAAGRLLDDATTDCVRRYRQVASWGDIAPMLGVTKQAANERFTRRISDLTAREVSGRGGAEE